MYRTLPFTIRITAGETAGALGGGGLGIILPIDFLELMNAHADRFLFRILARDFDKLINVGHVINP